LEFRIEKKNQIFLIKKNIQIFKIQKKIQKKNPFKKNHILDFKNLNLNFFFNLNKSGKNLKLKND
jgi:hypothetical protein